MDAYFNFPTATKLAYHLNKTRTKILRWFHVQRRKDSLIQQRHEVQSNSLEDVSKDSEDFKNIKICDITRESLLDDQTLPCYSNETMSAMFVQVCAEIVMFAV